jgi:hypothetical protein
MARVCPQCRRMTGDEELQCGECGGETVTPDVWQRLRQNLPKPTPKKKTEKAEQTPEQVESWARFGMGGMFAFFMFFLSFMIVYLSRTL